MRDANAHGRPAVVYLHPYDLPGERLRVAGPRNLRSRVVHARHAAIHNVGRARVSRTLQTILDSFEYTTLRELFGTVAA